MALSVLHQTVTPVGATFTPNLTLYGWFTLYWPATQDLLINMPTGLLNNGAEFIIDIIRAAGGPGDHAVNWDQNAAPGYYVGQIVDSINDNRGLWDGSGVTFGALLAARHHFLLLNSTAGLISSQKILAY